MQADDELSAYGGDAAWHEVAHKQAKVVRPINITKNRIKQYKY